MDNFNKHFEKKIRSSLSNNFGLDNYDEHRFGKYVALPHSRRSLIFNVKTLVKNVIGYNTKVDINEIDWLSEILPRLQRIYDNVSREGKSLIVELMAYRQLGYSKVKLKRNDGDYWKAVKAVDSLASSETMDPHFMHLLLEKFDLNKLGYNIKLYFVRLGVAIDFIIEQYAYKIADKTIVEVEKGDIVIDAGACWGDTALYFAYKAGDSGKVYSFEFIPDNIRLFNINKALNPHLMNQIELVEHPISNKADVNIYFKDNGPGSRIEFQPFTDQTGFTTTTTIDSFVKENNISKVDFIKMDIEGAELGALEGALETIKKHKPKLAIAIYHSMNDFVNIPNWILDLDLGYEIFIDHFTIHSEETICFAIVR